MATNYYRTLLAAVVALVFSTAGLIAQDSVARVFVVLPQPSASGFVDAASKQYAEAHKAMITELKRKKKTLTLVDMREDANIVIELLRVDYGDSGNSETKANILTPGV